MKHLLCSGGGGKNKQVLFSDVFVVHEIIGPYGRDSNPANTLAAIGVVSGIKLYMHYDAKQTTFEQCNRIRFTFKVSTDDLPDQVKFDKQMPRTAEQFENYTTKSPYGYMGYSIVTLKKKPHYLARFKGKSMPYNFTIEEARFFLDLDEKKNYAGATEAETDWSYITVKKLIRNASSIPKTIEEIPLVVVAK